MHPTDQNKPSKAKRPRLGTSVDFSAPLRESLTRRPWHDGLDWRRPVWMLSRISGVRENTIYQHCRRNGIKPVKSGATIKGLLLLALEMALQDLSADNQPDVPAVQSDEWRAWADETLLALGYRKEPNVPDKETPAKKPQASKL